MLPHALAAVTAFEAACGVKFPEAAWAGTRIISHHAEEELAKLKQSPGQDIVIPGRPALTAGLLHAGLLNLLTANLVQTTSVPSP